MFLQGLSVGVDATIMNSYMGRVLNRIKEAYERQDFDEARKQQVIIILHTTKIYENLALQFTLALFFKLF